MEKTFTVAGVSTQNGVVTARFASDIGRIKVLEKNGHTNVRLVTLPEAMGKDAALAYLRTNVEFQDAAAQEAINGVAVKTSAKPASNVAVKAAAPAKKLNKVATEHQELIDATDPVKVKNRELMRQTFAKIRQREFEEAEAARELRREELQLRVDNYMANVNEDVLPAFLRNR